MQKIDELDSRILNIMQNKFPLSAQPYQDMAESLNISEDEILKRIRAMCDSGIIRRIGGIMDSAKLGFYSTLCACRVADDQLKKTVEFINQHPGVTHNYLRGHEYNIWFTFTTASPDELSLFIKQLEEITGSKVLDMPARKVYKIKVSFDTGNNYEL